MTGATPDFSLAVGGPLYQRWLRSRLARSVDGHLVLRLVVLMAVAWLPLLLLATWSGNLLGGVPLPFLPDLDAQSRLLGALPLLLGTELLVHRRIRAVVEQFPERSILAPADLPAFARILDATVRWRNSMAVEVALLVLAFPVGHWLWLTQLRPEVDTWYAANGASGTELTPAGLWYAWVALPMLRFLLFRWYWRLCVWCRLLWRVSRLPLRLCAAHPDRVGGLGFLRDSGQAFVPLLLAHTVPVAGAVWTRIAHTGAELADFRVELAATVVLLLAAVLLPLLFFSRPLAAAKARAIVEHGRITAEAAQRSVADTAAAVRVGDAVERMRTWLLVRGDVVRLAAVAVLPFVPLLLTVFSPDEVLARACGLLF